MLIRHNLSAMNTQRQYSIVGKMKKAHMEKLSSGYRINRAADDAAGLAISEKMRRQIRGLEQGIKNAQDGVSLCQVADGALSEVHDLVQRLEELSVRAANGTNSLSDRESLQRETSKILTEIDRIADATKFNDQNLFGGETYRGVSVFHIKPAAGNAAANTRYGDFTVTGGTKGIDFDFSGDVLTIKSSKALTVANTKPVATTNRIEVEKNVSANITLQNVNIDVSGSGSIDSKILVRGNAAFQIADDSTGNVTITLVGENTLKSGVGCAGLQKNGGSGKLIILGNGTLRAVGGERGAGIGGGVEKSASHIMISSGTVSATGGTWAAGIGGGHGGVGSDINITSGAVVAKGGSDANNIGNGYDKETNKIQIVDYVSKIGMRSRMVQGVTNSGGGQSAFTQTELPVKRFWIQSGNEVSDRMFVEIDAMNMRKLGLSGLDVTTKQGASKAMDAVDYALAYVTSMRSKIGAQQNRLEHTIANERNVVENTTAAESRIRDADMAQEMVGFSILNILLKTGESMLAQANKENQRVLALLG